ncbi:MAG: FGGY-family carbohydrate kinase, partial [Planctomycetota bacterium]
GGGIQNKLLCQFTANALDKKVVTGPIEATAIGNVVMQAIAAGQINTLAEAREILRNSFDLEEYEPQDTAAWRQRYEESRK